MVMGRKFDYCEIIDRFAFVVRPDEPPSNLTMRIKDLTSCERPRERILSVGPGALSNGELLAILLRNGTKGHNVLDISRGLLNGCDGSLVALSRLTERELCTFQGIHKDKAATILAAFELGRRFFSERQESKDRPILCARDAYENLIPYLKGADHEEAWVILLNKAHKVIYIQTIGIGTEESVAINARQIAKLALEKGAAAMILAHNHPSGNPDPSRADITITDTLHKTCSACDIDLLDHIIICDQAFYSFADEMTVKI